MDRTWSMWAEDRGGEGKGKGGGQEGGGRGFVLRRRGEMWLFVARCCAVCAGEGRFTAETQRTRRGGEVGDCRFGGWVRFALVSGWCALAWFGRVWRVGTCGMPTLADGCLVGD